MKLAHEVCKELAGSLYDKLVQSKENAMAHLFDADHNVRKAAFYICDSVWKCSADIDFVNACRIIGVTDPDESVRVHAIGSYGKALQSSQDPAASQFLADLVKDRRISSGVREAAYWALREIQLGLTEEDNVTQLASLLKIALSKMSMNMTEEQVKTTLLSHGRYPESIWDSADKIDWSFVEKYASPKMTR